MSVVYKFYYIVRYYFITLNTTLKVMLLLFL
jgi:hypothetical protein